MKSVRWSLGLSPQRLSFPDRRNKIFMCRNLSVAADIYLQFGDTANPIADAWVLVAGETFVLDPAAPIDSVWVWTNAAGIDNRILMG